jgi:hypothetical protein
MIELSDEELVRRLTVFEDNFVERKTVADSRDWVKTIVAFANSLPVDYPGILYIGVKNDGTIEETVNLDSVQKKLSEKMENVFPHIYYLPKTVHTPDGKQFLAVIVPGSQSGPHFSGPSYIRDGSQTKKASEKEFDELISKRQSKTYELLKWRDKAISVSRMTISWTPSGGVGDTFMPFEAAIVDCNQFFVTFKHSSGGSVESAPLNRIDLSFDNNANRLKLEVYPIAISRST